MSDKRDEGYIGPEEETIRGEPSPFFQPKDALLGTEVGGYLVKGRLGSGGMGIVYEGEQTVIGKRVAIKVLKSDVADNPDVVRRLVAEAKAVNSIGHRNIIDVFGFAQLPDGRQAIIMELLEGESLEALLERYHQQHATVPVVDALLILDEMLAALAAAHAAGVIHRDLKPSNIFLCQQRDGTRYVKILDFGIAKLGVLGDAAQNASVLVGTPAYMAPEQATGGVVTPALDLYAVGVMAFELLTGRLPFFAESLLELVTKHAQEKPPPPSRFMMDLPDELDELVLKLLEKRPEDRYASADSVRTQIIRLKKQLNATTSLRTGPPLGSEQVIVDESGTEDTLLRAPALKITQEAKPDDVTLPPRGSAALRVQTQPDNLEDTARRPIEARPEDLEDTVRRQSPAPQPSADDTQTAERRYTPTARVLRKVPARRGVHPAVWVALALILAALGVGVVVWQGQHAAPVTSPAP